ncbi:hypothetical protein T492DRAFT_531795 [Pavlovales sp. CCMP2436]|nr:hypothetical protein T492DRAFT_531795 [Pavlovales sp. CCMP2436]
MAPAAQAALPKASGAQKRALKRDEGKEESAVEQEAVPSQLEQIRACFAWQVWPWWVSLLAAAYLLTKLHLLYESPCAVLATTSPVTRGDISKAYRQVSMCTHPDRLIGSSSAQQARGVALFTRVTSARDELLDRLRPSSADLEKRGLNSPDGPQPAASCMSSALERGMCVNIYKNVRPRKGLPVS